MRRAPRHAQALAYVVGAALAVGCEASATSSGGSETFESRVPPFTVGTRLTPRFLDGGDGARVLFDFFDQELGTPCRFSPTTEGTYRCVPSSPATCSVGPEFTCGQAAFSTGLDLDACGKRVATGVAQAPPGSPSPKPLHEFLVLTCVGSGIGPVADNLALPLESFVGARLESVDLAPGLAVHRLVANDGASVSFGFARDGQPCTPTRFGGALRCLDASLASLTHPYASVDLFVGPACTGDRAAFCPVSCSAPRARLAVVPADVDACPDEATYFEVAEDAPQVSELAQTGECFDVDEAYFAEYGRFARLGAEVPSSALPTLEQREIVGTGRLRVRAVVGGGAAIGTPLAVVRSEDLPFFDTELQTPCSAQLGSDGQLRCLPIAAPWAYGDDQCTQVILGKAPDPCGGAEQSRFLPRNDGPRECGSGFAPTEVLERGEPYLGPVYGLGGNGACTTRPGSDGEWFLPGAIHPLSDFVVVSLTE